MKLSRLSMVPVAILVLAFATTSAATAAQSAGKTDQSKASDRVTVNFQKPHEFTESHLIGFGFGHDFDHGNYMEKLRAFLVEKTTPMLEDGQHLTITFTDIRLAGGFEPWHGPQWADVRVMRDIYPPRFHFTFTLTGPDGKTLRHGKLKLIGLGYLQSAPPAVGGTDSLRYSKQVLYRWLRRGPSDW
ncbi:MAG TPA: DUF3016 domain-containing protein [Oleiagrimonas sp.]|nr:DUF3016 domain-containing protein [Oleiagrimonas sp.]